MPGSWRELYRFPVISGHIKHTVLQQGTVVPADVSDNSSTSHVYVWRIVYTNKEMKD